MNKNTQLINDFEKALLECFYHKYQENTYIKPIGFACLYAKLLDKNSPVYTMGCLIVSTDFDKNNQKEVDAFNKMESEVYKDENVNLVDLDNDIKSSFDGESLGNSMTMHWRIKAIEQNLITNLKAPVVYKQYKMGKRWIIT